MSYLIAVVEDDTRALELIRLVLEQNGYRVMAWSNPQVAQARLPQVAPQAIIMDLHLGIKMTGVEMLEYFRAQPGALKVPAIVYSADVSALEALRGTIEANGWDMLAKPFAPEELLAKLEQAIASGGAAKGRS